MKFWDIKDGLVGVIGLWLARIIAGAFLLGWLLAAGAIVRFLLLR